MKKLLATLGIITTGAFGADVATFDGRVVTDRDVPVAEEMVKVRQVENTVEVELPWKDADPIKVKYDMGEPTLGERVGDKRKREVVTETVDFGEGGFKVDILLNEKPDTNVFCYTIENHQNYDFFYQPPLTDEEKAAGASRPFEIEGSYAVYHKTLKNHREGGTNYQAGKVMHIPRPQVWEMGNKATLQLADLSYENGQLCVTAPQEFIDTATYPVRIDPTFGYTSTCGTQSASSNDKIRGSWYSLSENGDVSSISAYTDVASGQELDMAIYDQSDDSFIASPPYNTFSGPLAWRTLTFGSPEPLTSGSYWLVTYPDADGMGLWYDSGDTGKGLEYQASDYEGTDATFPDPISSYTAQSRQYCVYATYTATGGGGEPAKGQSEIWFQ